VPPPSGALCWGRTDPGFRSFLAPSASAGLRSAARPGLITEGACTIRFADSVSIGPCDLGFRCAPSQATHCHPLRGFKSGTPARANHWHPLYGFNAGTPTLEGCNSTVNSPNLIIRTTLRRQIFFIKSTHPQTRKHTGKGGFFREATNVICVHLRKFAVQKVLESLQLFDTTYRPACISDATPNPSIKIRVHSR
jgi:hypothetical protein